VTGRNQGSKTGGGASEFIAMDEMTVMTCVAHIRAAAKLCEDAGMLACWANLLGVPIA
jgi:hypothetical protein